MLSTSLFLVVIHTVFFPALADMDRCSSQIFHIENLQKSRREKVFTTSKQILFTANLPVLKYNFTIISMASGASWRRFIIGYQIRFPVENKLENVNQGLKQESKLPFWIMLLMKSESTFEAEYKTGYNINELSPSFHIPKTGNQQYLKSKIHIKTYAYKTAEVKRLLRLKCCFISVSTRTHQSSSINVRLHPGF